LRSGAAEITPELDAGSVADSLTVAAPRNAVMALKDVRASGGCGVLVSEDAILDAIPRLAAATGVFAEPAAAIALAGLEIALAEGYVARDERVVLLVTGTGLKDVPAASRRVRVPEPASPTMEAVEALFG
ncbi:partial Threonine synthase, partial [Gammaproteobacteria bacterium]